MTALAKLHNSFPTSILGAKVPEPVAEFRFHRTRKWRFDWAWPAYRIALEVDGGLFVQGRHSRGAGQLADFEKINEALIHGWRVFRCTPKQVRNGEATLLIARAIGGSAP